MLSATSDDDLTDGGNTASSNTDGGDTSTGTGSGIYGPDQFNGGGDTLTSGVMSTSGGDSDTLTSSDTSTGGCGGDTLTGGDTSTGGGGGDTLTGGNMPPILTVTLLPIPDTAVNGDVVGYATATDPDVGDTITFSFDGGSLTDPSGTFEIDANTGVITIRNADNIGSQDENDDSGAGWSFAATVGVSDGVNIPPIFAGITFMIIKSPYQVITPVDGGTIKMTEDLNFKATRVKGMAVKAEILVKDATGAWVKPSQQGAVTTMTFSGVGDKTGVVTNNFKKGTVGEYKLIYTHMVGGKWDNTTAIEVLFTVTPP